MMGTRILQQARWGKGMLLPVFMPFMLMVIGGCALAPSERYGQVSCGSAFQPDSTAPYQPGIVCLAFDGGSMTRGARTGEAPPVMQAVRAGGRVFLMETRRGMAPEGER